MAVFFVVILSLSVIFFGSSSNPEKQAAAEAKALKYSQNETLAINEFREMMAPELYLDYMKSDVYLIRWLRAREFNMDAAKEMLQAALAWRKQVKLDGIQNETLRDMSKPTPIHQDGTDHEGNLVFTLVLNRMDSRAIIMSGKKDKTIRLLFQYLDYAELQIMERSGVIGNRVVRQPAPDRFVLILDAEGFTTKQHVCKDCLLIYMELFRALEEYFPQYIKHLILVNAPRALVPLLEMLKTNVLSRSTLRVLKVFWTNQDGWKSFLKEIVPAEQLWPPLGNRIQI